MKDVNKYGESISRCEAHSYLNELVLLKDANSLSLQRMFSERNPNRRYYCGRHKEAVDDADVQQEEQARDQMRDFDDVAFIFDKDALSDILKALTEKDGADGVVIFNGLRNCVSDRRVRPNSDDDGRPTVMIFPYKYKVDKGVPDDEELEIMLDEGREHPGTGGKVVEVPYKSKSRFEVPERFKVTDIYKKK